MDLGVLEGRVALVTGAGRGLGRAVATAFAREGALVVISSEIATELAATAERIRSEGGRVREVVADLASSEGCGALAEAARSDATRIDVLVNNAAALKLTPLESLALEEWDGTLAVNLTAPFLLTRAFLPDMRRHGGSIVNVSSRAGVAGFADETAYCASKFGLEGFTRALALELVGRPVSVNTVTPGLRIKPTSITEEQARIDPAREQWNDPAEITPAFVLLATLRGEPSGLRFDAARLSRAAAAHGGEWSYQELKELAE
jgi:NAD(P)-dependent dehydrogenase (short-subunit alcohol dehydrogenase family)